MAGGKRQVEQHRQGGWQNATRNVGSSFVQVVRADADDADPDAHVSDGLCGIVAACAVQTITLTMSDTFSSRSDRQVRKSTLLNTLQYTYLVFLKSEVEITSSVACLHLPVLFGREPHCSG